MPNAKRHKATKIRSHGPQAVSVAEDLRLGLLSGHLASVVFITRAGRAASVLVVVAGVLACEHWALGHDELAGTRWRRSQKRSNLACHQLRRQRLAPATRRTAAQGAARLWVGVTNAAKLLSSRVFATRRQSPCSKASFWDPRAPPVRTFL